MTDDLEAKVTRSITLPRYLWDALREKADGNERTLNGEIAYRLKRSIETDEADHAA